MVEWIRRRPNNPSFSSSRPTAGKENFLLKFLDLIINNEIPKLKLFSQQDLVGKTTAQKPKVQQLSPPGSWIRKQQQRHLVATSKVPTGNERRKDIW